MEALQFADEQIESEFADQPEIKADLYMTIGKTYLNLGQTEKAEPLLRESLALREKTLAKDHWILDTSRSILGEYLARVEKFTEAESLVFDSYKNLKQKLGENHEQRQNALKRVEKFQNGLLN